MNSDNQDGSVIAKTARQDTADGYQSLPDHAPNNFSTIINSSQRRSTFYQERIHDSWDGLQKDIERWKATFKQVADGTGGLPSDALVHHHIEQFELFALNAFKALVDTSQVAQGSDQEEAEDFQALVIGVFTSQWLLLRDVIIQRVTGSPYRDGLKELDADVNKYYARLYNEISGKLVEAELNERYRARPLVSFAPLIYLGNSTQITVFNRRAPLMISVPFGALPKMPYSNYTRLSLAHEVSHAIFTQVPEIVKEIKRTLTEQLITNATPRPPRSRSVIIEMIIEWVEEICADMIGTALGGIDYVESARRIMSGTVARVGVTDEAHPPAVLRPMIHLLALATIAADSGNTQLSEDARKGLKEILNDTADSAERVKLLGRQFQSMPALMFVRLGTVGNVLIEILEKHLLPMPLKTLGGTTVVSLLQDINKSTQDTIPRPEGGPQFEPWVDPAQITSGEFVLDFPESATTPVYATPGIFSHPFCCESPSLRDWCCFA